MAAPLENYPYLSGRVTKVVYNKKILKTAAVFPSSTVVVVTRADAQVPSIVVPNEFWRFLQKIKKLSKHYYSSTKWILGARAGFGSQAVAAARSMKKKRGQNHRKT